MRKRKHPSGISGYWFLPVQTFNFVVNLSADEVIERLRQRHQEPHGILDLRYLVQIEVNEDEAQASTAFSMYSSNTILTSKEDKRTYPIQGEVTPQDNVTCRVSGKGIIDRETALKMYGAILICSIIAFFQELAGSKPLVVFILPFPIYFLFWLQISDRKTLLRELEKTLFAPRKPKAKAIYAEKTKVSKRLSS